MISPSCPPPHSAARLPVAQQHSSFLLRARDVNGNAAQTPARPGGAGSPHFFSPFHRKGCKSVSEKNSENCYPHRFQTQQSLQTWIARDHDFT